MTAQALALSVVPTDTLALDVEAGVAALFAAGYRDADVDYLRTAMRRLGRLALAHTGGRLVGFSLGDSRRLDLPQLPGQMVRLAGLACVSAEHRRHGLMSRLSSLAMGVTSPDERQLFCGRMAHPATYRMMMRLRGVVPRLGAPPSAWHQAVGRAIADAYGAPAFDPETFVCGGRGRPIGYPAMDVEAPPEVWTLFAPVDRGRGDSLLGFAWLGEPPPGW